MDDPIPALCPANLSQARLTSIRKAPSGAFRLSVSGGFRGQRHSRHRGIPAAQFSAIEGRARLDAREHAHEAIARREASQLSCRHGGSAFVTPGG
jgi:hypothetical protein